MVAKRRFRWSIPAGHTTMPEKNRFPTLSYATLKYGITLSSWGSAMGKTMADVLIEKGERQGLQKGERKAGIQTRQQTRMRLLRRRFEEVPAEIVRAVQATRDIDRLDQ